MPVSQDGAGGQPARDPKGGPDRVGDGDVGLTGLWDKTRGSWERLERDGYEDVASRLRRMADRAMDCEHPDGWLGTWTDEAIELVLLAADLLDG